MAKRQRRHKSIESQPPQGVVVISDAGDAAPASTRAAASLVTPIACTIAASNPDTEVSSDFSCEGKGSALFSECAAHVAIPFRDAHGDHCDQTSCPNISGASVDMSSPPVMLPAAQCGRDFNFVCYIIRFINQMQ